MTKNSKNEKIVNFNKNNMVYNEKNPKNHICISFINEVKKHLESTNTNNYNHVSTENIDMVKPIKPKIAKILVINNENDLLEFYNQNNIDGKIPSKPDTAKLTGLNIEKIRRLNDKLKELNKIETKGKSIFLIGGEN